MTAYILSLREDKTKTQAVDVRTCEESWFMISFQVHIQLCGLGHSAYGGTVHSGLGSSISKEIKKMPYKHICRTI